MRNFGTTRYNNWRLQQDADGVLWLALDRQDQAHNTLSEQVFSELADILDQIKDLKVPGLVLLSAKPQNFVLGADIREFENFDSEQHAIAQIRVVHALFQRIVDLPYTTVAGIHGLCLGGGLELALCFDYRIAIDTPNTKMGLPEVKLGIFPGFGGATRSIENMGGPNALGLLLAGRVLSARAAKSVGWVNQVIDIHGSLRWAARKAVMQNRKAAKPSWKIKLSNSWPARLILAPIIRKQVAQKANPLHYPAPFQLLDLWRKHGNNHADMLEAEAQGVGKLLLSETSTNLRRVFYLSESLKARGKKSPFKAKRVHVIGAGVMGGDIAAWCALRGLDVTLQDRGMEYITPAIIRAKKLFKKRLKKPALVAAAVTRLTADPEGIGVTRADVLIEAIFENLEAKQELFKSVEQCLKPDCILATNTSAIPLEDIAKGLKQPQRLIGLHFFNPVAQMPLLEVIQGQQSAIPQIDKACAFANQIQRFPVVAKSSPGFLVNRILVPYLVSALQAYRDGTPKEALDAAAMAFGMPMGPVELVDVVGLDICYSVTQHIMPNGQEDNIKWLKSFVDKKHLGKKTGQGLYKWKNGKAIKNLSAIKGHDLIKLHEAMLTPFFKECQACIDEGIVENQDHLDAGVVFGTGFAPFRGGPLCYIDQLKQHKQGAVT